MSTPLLPSFRRQQLVLDFSSLRDDCPEGIYLSITPGAPSLWGGVFFVRDGPYAEAILRFQIAFPDTYPAVPPLVTFSTDVFHPLVVPLTTYTFSASADASGTVSASDDDRLPPGAFSLRYGFPDWVRRGPWQGASGGAGRTSEAAAAQDGTSTDEQTEPAPSSARSGAETTGEPPSQLDRRAVLLALLHHIHAAFTSAPILDALPLAAAGNPSAWHAWRAHRGTTPAPAAPAPAATTGSSGTQTTPTAGMAPSSPSSPKHPGAWKWDGVWESRVASAVSESVAESTLFGSSATSAGAGLGLGLKGDHGASRFGASMLGGTAGSVNATGTAGAGLDARQKAQLLADRQIRFSKLADEGVLDVRRRVGAVGDGPVHVDGVK